MERLDGIKMQVSHHFLLEMWKGKGTNEDGGLSEEKD